MVLGRHAKPNWRPPIVAKSAYRRQAELPRAVPRRERFLERERYEFKVCWWRKKGSRCGTTPWQTWQRPTLPRLKTEYHRRWGVSRPSSEWDRVQPPRNYHQVGEGVMQTGLPRDLGDPGDGHCIMRAIKPIELLVPVSSTHCCASTPGLSTWSSSTALKGVLVLRWVSRLDAFSGYPVRT